MSKKFSWSGVLVALVIITVLANVSLCYRYVRLMSATQQLTAQTRELQALSTEINNRRAVLQKLALASLQHAEKNPAILSEISPFFPMLEEIGVNVAPKQATAPPTP